MLDNRLLLLVLGFILVTSGVAFCVDTDLDGLSDDVETNVLHSSPTHKDIFVEIDYLIQNGRSMRPVGGVTQVVTAVFAAAPILNPDGTYGIRLHATINQGIPFPKAALGFSDANGNYLWSEFDQIKNQYFASSRRGIYHYCLFVNAMGDAVGNPNGISGISRNLSIAQFRQGASDFIVALGQGTTRGWSQLQTPSPLKWIQAGTFLHELGHNLGLKHGGADHISFKPNDLSVMSYYYQTDGIPITQYSDQKRYYLYDYSEVKNGPLNENNLCDQCGLGVAAQVTGTYGWWYGTRWFAGIPTTPVANQVFVAVGASNCAAYQGCVDWNKNNVIDRSKVNLNLDKGPHFGFLEYTNLTGGIKEWPILVYNGGTIGKANPSSIRLPSHTPSTCLRLHDATIQSTTPGRQPEATPVTLYDLRRIARQLEQKKK